MGPGIELCQFLRIFLLIFFSGLSLSIYRELNFAQSYARLLLPPKAPLRGNYKITFEYMP